MHLENWGNLSTGIIYLIQEFTDILGVLLGAFVHKTVQKQEKSDAGSKIQIVFNKTLREKWQ